MRTDFWALLGTEHCLIAALFVFALAGAVRHFEWKRETALASGVVAVTFAFWFVSSTAYSGALRYIVIAVPILYGFAARELLRPRYLGYALVTALAVSLYVPRHRDARALAGASREQHEHRLGGFDPRPALHAIEEGGYTVCYADFWLAYKLEWLSKSGVRMIPYRSVNRTMVKSLRLAGAPGRKCFVDLDGSVRELTAREAAEFRRDTLRLVSGAKP